MATVDSYDELICNQRKEKKELLAKTAKMKHGVPKGDKKKKKEVTSEIAQLLACLDLKHENELKEFSTKNRESFSNGGDIEKLLDVSNVSEAKSVDDVLRQSAEETGDNDHDHESSENFQKLSKAQRRRNKKALIAKERIKAIAEQEIENLTGVRYRESEEIKRKLSKRHLVIHEVPSDGNCLYKAIEHQLFILKLEQTTVESLRELTAKYLLSHMEDYLPFLTCPETGDILSEEQFVKYCADITDSSTWGGHIEIQALSQVFGKPIEIIQAEGPSVIAGDESTNPRLMLSYHRHIYGLGEHYNSVVPASSVD